MHLHSHTPDELQVRAQGMDRGRGTESVVPAAGRANRKVLSHARKEASTICVTTDWRRIGKPMILKRPCFDEARLGYYYEIFKRTELMSVRYRVVLPIRKPIFMANSTGLLFPFAPFASIAKPISSLAKLLNFPKFLGLFGDILPNVDNFDCTLKMSWLNLTKLKFCHSLRCSRMSFERLRISSFILMNSFDISLIIMLLYYVIKEYIHPFPRTQT